MKYQVPQRKTVNRAVKPISKTKIKRCIDVSLPLFTKVQDQDGNDVFKIDIPEEMIIIGSFDPSLQGKFGKVTSLQNGEAVFEMLSKKGIETIVIPDFCLIRL
jgi:hypothetical protein